MAAELTADKLAEMLRRAIDHLPWLANNVLLIAAVGCDMSFGWRACKKVRSPIWKRESHENANAPMIVIFKTLQIQKSEAFESTSQKPLLGLPCKECHCLVKAISADAHNSKRITISAVVATHTLDHAQSLSKCRDVGEAFQTNPDKAQAMCANAHHKVQQHR